MVEDDPSPTAPEVFLAPPPLPGCHTLLADT